MLFGADCMRRCDIPFLGSDILSDLVYIDLPMIFVPRCIHRTSCERKKSVTNKDISQLVDLNAVQEPGVSIAHFLDSLL